MLFFWMLSFLSGLLVQVKGLFEFSPGKPFGFIKTAKAELLVSPEEAPS
jgi:hypothetical protein